MLADDSPQVLHCTAGKDRTGMTALAVLWSVRPAFLHAAFDRIERHHGGLSCFLEQRLQIDKAARERLAALYLGHG